MYANTLEAKQIRPKNLIGFTEDPHMMDATTAKKKTIKIEYFPLYSIWYKLVLSSRRSWFVFAHCGKDLTVKGAFR